MACTITQADLGPAFAAVDADVADLFILTATEIVLGPAGACQVQTEAAWRGCCVDPCRAIVLLAQHLLSVTSGTGGGTSQILSKRVGDISITYANATANSGIWTGSPYGVAYSVMARRFDLCRSRRNTFPIAVGPRGGCGC